MLAAKDKSKLLFLRNFKFPEDNYTPLQILKKKLIQAIMFEFPSMGSEKKVNSIQVSDRRPRLANQRTGDSSLFTPQLFRSFSQSRAIQTLHAESQAASAPCFSDSGALEIHIH